MDSLGNILYLCTLLHIIFEHLHDLHTLNSLAGWKELRKFIPRDWLNSTLIHVLFSLYIYIIYVTVKGMLTFSFFWKTIVSLWKQRWKIENETIVFKSDGFFQKVFFFKWSFFKTIVVSLHKWEFGKNLKLYVSPIVPFLWA